MPMVSAGSTEDLNNLTGNIDFRRSEVKLSLASINSEESMLMLMRSIRDIAVCSKSSQRQI
jgi:hypothetical protein